MERMNKLSNRLPMSMFLLLIVLTFSKCKKDLNEVVPQDEVEMSAETQAATTTTTTESAPKALSMTNAKSDGGYAYKVNVNLGTTGDSPEKPSSSTVKIYENGVELSAAHSTHADIRKIGKGNYSHWLTSTIYLSASDNSNPKTNGKKYTYTIGGTTTTTPVGGVTTPETSPVATTPIASSNSIIGYAMVDGKTTGGEGGQTVTVSTLSALKSAVASSSPSIIKVSGKITGTGFLNVSSNKTILGMKGSSLEGVGLMIYGTNNVIIRNMTIRNVVTYSNIIIKEGAHHVWVDHCELSSDRTHGWEYYDGLLDVGKRADYVTLSWNKLHDNHIPMLIGFGDESTADIGHLRVTVYYNYFYNVSERQPSTRFGYMHVFNNYMKDGSGYAVGVTMGATVRTDNNYFENQNVPITSAYNAKPGYISGASTNVYKNSGANTVSTAASTWVPTYEYESILIPAANVPAIVTAQAGATLSL
ncbi:pectate lyase family protein [Pedobacter sp.]|uniref:pectate lyase family protein n=1 Tax=Pedobacter sp. TaxID=1411316 RepID=UPI003D7F96FF